MKNKRAKNIKKYTEKALGFEISQSKSEQTPQGVRNVGKSAYRAAKKEYSKMSAKDKTEFNKKTKE